MGKKKRGKNKRKTKAKSKGNARGSGRRSPRRTARRSAGGKTTQTAGKPAGKSDLLWKLYWSPFYGNINGEDGHNFLHRVYAFLPLLADARALLWIRTEFVEVFERCVKKWCSKEELLLKWYCLCCPEGVFLYNSTRAARLFYQRFMLPMANSNMLALLRKLRKHRLPTNALYGEKDSPFRYLLRGNVKTPLLACAQHLQAQWMLKHLEEDPDDNEGEAYSAWKYRILFWWKHAAENGCAPATLAIETYKKQWNFS